MLILLVMGVMNLTAMALVSVIIALEKLAPRPERIVKLTGLCSLGAGIVMIVRSFPWK